jgi:RNA polymerase binding protein RbpA
MRTMNTGAMRATRVGAGPAGEPYGGGFTVAKIIVPYHCANGHRTTVPFISTVVVPSQWECRVCSQPAGTTPTTPTTPVEPPPPDSSPAADYLGGKSHLGHVKSRRSPAEGDALMAESLARRDHPEDFNIWAKTGRRKYLDGFGGDLTVTVQRRRVGGGAAGIPAFRVADPAGPVIRDAVAEHLIDRVVDGLVPGREHGQ